MMKKNFIWAIMIAALCTSCSKEESKDLQVNPSNLTMHYGENHQLSVLNATGTFEWSVDNEFNAKVDNTGYVTGNHVGTTTIFAKQGDKKGSCTVKITPQSNLYDTPYFAWGKSKSTVKAKLGTPDGETSTALTYVLSSSLGIIAMYLFENDQLNGVCVVVKITNLTSLTTYLTERYQLLDYKNDIYYFADALSISKCTLALSLQLTKLSGSYVYLVTYMDGTPYNAPQRSNARPSQEYTIPSNLEYLFK